MATGEKRTASTEEYQFPPPGVAIDGKELLQFEGLRHDHELVPKDPSKAPPQFQSKQVVIECRICSRHYESVHAAVVHALRDDRHKKRYKAKQIEARLREVSTLDLSSKHIDSLTELLEAVYTEHAAECQEIPNLRLAVYEELKGLVQNVMPDVTVELFGSSLSGFALKDSDVNINLNYQVQEDEKINPRMPSVLKSMLRTLHSHSDVYGSIEPCFYQFIPCIQCKHLKTGLHLDIRAGQHEAAVAINTLLKVYGAIDRRAKVLGFAFRYWAKVCRLDDQESGLYPSIMFVAMVVYFLQQKDKSVLPVLHELLDTEHGDPGEEEMNSVAESVGSDSQYFDDLPSLHLRWKSESEEPLGLLWFQLLRFYTVEFQTPDHVISLKQSKVVERGKEWPGNRLALEHPFMNRYDLAKAVASQPAHDYRKACLRHALTYFCILPAENNDQPSAQRLQLPAPTPPISGESKPRSESVEDMEVVDCPDQVDEGTEMEEDTREHSQVKGGGGRDEGGQTTEGGKVAGGLVDPVPQQGSPGPKLSFAEYRKCVTENPPVCCTFCKQDGHRPEKCPNEISGNKPDTTCTLEPGLKEYVDKLMRGYVVRHGLHQRGTKARQRVKNDILKDILVVYPEADLQIFGSSGNGFGTESSDLDLCLLLPGADTAEEKVEVIESLVQMMKKHPDRKYSKLVPIKSARVPIIKFYYTPKSNDWSTECDISLGNTLAVHNTRMLAAYARVDERVKLLGHALKCLMKSCGVADASQGSFSSYAYILLVIHYLQRTSPPVVPVLQLLPEEGRVNEVAGWNCYFFDFESHEELKEVWPQVLDNKAGVVDLWIDMLRYYAGTFNWHKHVVCIRQDPKENHLDKFSKLWVNKPGCVEDPFDLSHNLGTVVSVRMFKFIHNVFVNAANFFGAGGKHQLTLKTMCIRGHAENLSMLLNRDLLTNNKKAPVDPKFWDRMNRGEDTDNPPHKDKGPPPNKRRNKDFKKGAPKQDMGSKGKTQDVSPKAGPASQQQKHQRISNVHSAQPTSAPQAGVQPSGSRTKQPPLPVHPGGSAPLPSPAHHGAPLPSPAHHGVPLPSPAHHSAPLPSSAHHGAPLPSPAHHGAPLPSPAHHGAPLPSPAHHGAPLPSSAHHGAPLPSSAHHGAPLPSPAHHGAPLPSSAHHGAPLPSPAHHGAPLPSSAHHGAPLPSSAHHGAPLPSPMHHGGNVPFSSPHAQGLIRLPSPLPSPPGRSPLHLEVQRDSPPQSPSHVPGYLLERAWAPLSPHHMGRGYPAYSVRGPVLIPSQVYPSIVLAKAEARTTPSSYAQDIPHTSVPPVMQSHSIPAGLGKPRAAIPPAPASPMEDSDQGSKHDVSRQPVHTAVQSPVASPVIAAQGGAVQQIHTQSTTVPRREPSHDEPHSPRQSAQHPSGGRRQQKRRNKKHPNASGQQQPVVADRQPVVEKQPMAAERQTVVGERQPVVAERQTVVAERQTVVAEKQSVAVERQPVVAEKQPALVEKHFPHPVDNGQHTPGKVKAGNGSSGESRPRHAQQPGRRWDHHHDVGRGRGRGGRGRGQRGRRGGGRQPFTKDVGPGR